MNVPKIIIMGKAGSGKSGLAKAIKHLLRENYNINCSIEGREDETQEEMDNTWEDRVKSLRRKSIKIETMQEKNSIKGIMTEQQEEQIDFIKHILSDHYEISLGKGLHNFAYVLDRMDIRRVCERINKDIPSFDIGCFNDFSNYVKIGGNYYTNRDKNGWRLINDIELEEIKLNLEQYKKEIEGKI